MPRLESPFAISTESVETQERQKSTSSSKSGFRIYYNQDRWKRQWLRAFLRKFDDIFTRIIPVEDVKDMPPRYKYGIGGIALLGLLGIFLALFITSYQRQKTQAFLAPLNAKGSQSSANCETLFMSNSGEYLATKFGSWEGGPGFTYSLAAYTFYLKNWVSDQTFYSDVMDGLYEDALVYIGQNMSTYNLGRNILYWTSYNQVPDVTNPAERFYPVGDPVAVFNREYVTGHLSSSLGVCNASFITRFLPNEANVYLQTNYQEYLYEPICNNTVTPSLLGYRRGVNTKIFEINLDIRSLFTAIAVNLGILHFDNLVVVEGSQVLSPVGDTFYNVSQYYDPKFPGMTPFSCITTTNKRQFCTIQVGLAFTMPILNHKGNSTQLPYQCMCEYLTSDELSDRYNPCNTFEFLAGLIIWQTNKPEPLFAMLEKFDYSFEAINNASFHAAFASSYWGETSDYTQNLQSTEYLTEAFSFCNLPEYGECSLLTISAFDNSYYDWTVSKYYYQLQNGACSASLTPTKENW